MSLYMRGYRICNRRQDLSSLLLDFDFVFFVISSPAKHFHNLRVSSAPAETTVEPSGDMHM
uniref:Uncharacterized protein n=1 Tax=Arion vulgaris TaxID=1028688 RepID=A0A0B7A4D9_9EUPU